MGYATAAAQNRVTFQLAAAAAADSDRKERDHLAIKVVRVVAARPNKVNFAAFRFSGSFEGQR